MLWNRNNFLADQNCSIRSKNSLNLNSILEVIHCWQELTVNEPPSINRDKKFLTESHMIDLLFFFCSLVAGQYFKCTLSKIIVPHSSGLQRRSFKIHCFVLGTLA